MERKRQRINYCMYTGMINDDTVCMLLYPQTQWFRSVIRLSPCAMWPCEHALSLCRCLHCDHRTHFALSFPALEHALSLCLLASVTIHTTSLVPMRACSLVSLSSVTIHHFEGADTGCRYSLHNGIPLSPTTAGGRSAAHARANMGYT